jgi:hypothetical protein
VSENPNNSSLFSKLFNRIPKFWPKIEMDTEPVVGEFVISIDDTLETSYEKNLDTAMCFESTKI